MALTTKVKECEFGVGDKIRVTQRVDKRESNFEGIVIKIKGRGQGATFTVRRIGEGGIGIEKIFPINLPSIEKVAVLKRGVEGVRHAKLYYIRKKTPTEIEAIYKKAAIRRAPKEQGKSKNKSAITAKRKRRTNSKKK